MIIHSDVATEADDPFAIVHHLLTPSEKVTGIIAATAAIWIGGGIYPEGGDEPNLREDIYAAQVLFDSQIPIW